MVPDRREKRRQPAMGQVSRAIKLDVPQVTTVISYSDPSAGHTGALYKACNWKWRPTWHVTPTPYRERLMGGWRSAVSQRQMGSFHQGR